MASLSASETEFLAEQELITIMPHFHLRGNGGMLNLISGNFGPFQPGITTHVPLWLAIMLKQLNKCRIIAPAWLSVGRWQLIELLKLGTFQYLVPIFMGNNMADYLTTRLEREKSSEVFEELPFHYLEVASLLFKNAPEDLDQGEHLRSLLEDLQNLRQDKIRNGLANIASDVQSGGTARAIQMNNISALEINSVREFMLGVRSIFSGLVSILTLMLLT
ncbi:hypothetical protein V7S43_009463 [Phytophthora oleae]|uniref:DNA replication complex GINS protein PSF2 n=1 Tax=Phytophthora oleae TaxID=2107226 RepID=A0ABD3FFA6_9STRA